jgi:2-iminobutanoate/2-iminopropanoate deaminase
VVALLVLASMIAATYVVTRPAPASSERTQSATSFGLGRDVLVAAGYTGRLGGVAIAEWRPAAQVAGFTGRLGAATESAMMKRTKIAAPEFGLRTGAFSNAYCVEVGDAVIIHTAGHLAVDASGSVVGGADTARQAEHIYGVIENILRAAGATLDHVVKTTAYMTDIRDYPAVNEIRNKVFAGREPASTIVEVSKFVHPGAKIEIEAVAIRPRA